jgi:hypothetical protein
MRNAPAKTMAGLTMISNRLPIPANLSRFLTRTDPATLNHPVMPVRIVHDCICHVSFQNRPDHRKASYCFGPSYLEIPYAHGLQMVS